MKTSLKSKSISVLVGNQFVQITAENELNHELIIYPIGSNDIGISFDSAKANQSYYSTSYDSIGASALVVPKGSTSPLYIQTTSPIYVAVVDAAIASGSLVNVTAILSYWETDETERKSADLTVKVVGETGSRTHIDSNRTDKVWY